MLEDAKSRQSEAYVRFSYGITSEVTRKKYSRELQLFLDHSGFDGSTLQQKAQNFYDFCIKSNANQISDFIIKYLLFQIKELEWASAKSTIRNYYKPLKLFCEMNNIILNWKIISKGITKIIRYV